MIRFAILFVAVVLCVPTFGQEFLSSEDDCYIDPITKRQVCPLKKTVAVAGIVASKVGAALTPDSVAIPIHPSQAYSMPATTYSYAPVQSYQHQSGWSKSWHSVSGQPIRNLGRRILGR